MTTEGGSCILFSNENFGAFFLIFLSTILLFLHKKRTQSSSSSSTPSTSSNVSVPLSSSNRIPGPLGVDHSKKLALAGSLTAYVSLLHKEYNSSIVQFYRSPGDLVVSCYDVELLNSTLRGMGTRPSGLFEFLTRMLGEDNLQIYPFLDAKNLRSLIRPGLDHSFIKNQFDTTILKVFENHLLELKKRCEAQSDPSHSLSVRFQHELLVAGIRAGSLLIFGGDVEKENQIPDMEKFTNDFHTLVDSAVESGLAPLSSQRQQDFEHSKQAVEEALYNVIHIRREAMTRKEAGEEEEEGEKKKENKKVDVLSLLLENEDPLTGKPFTDEKIVMLLKMSTNYTPAVASTWVLHLLAAHPEYMTHLVSEIDQVFSSKEYQGQQSLTYDDLDPKVTPFLDAVVKETLRIYPTSPFAVRLVEDPKGHDLGKGYHLPPGTTLFVPIRDLQFNEKLWPDPERFDPSRWLDEKRPPHPLSSMPFGFGLRRCPGEKLAWIQIKTLVVEILRRFDIEPHNTESKKIAENTAEAFVLWAKDDIELQIRPRDM